MRERESNGTNSAKTFKPTSTFHPSKQYYQLNKSLFDF